MNRKTNTYTWTAWVLLALSLAVLTYNPVYHTLLLLALLTLSWRHRVPVAKTLKAGILFGTPLLLINILLVHHGNHVLVSIPKKLILPGFAIPIYGIAGPITLESIYAAIIFMLLLINTLLTFSLYNKVTSPDNILRIIPKKLSNSTLLVAITLRFIPTISADAQTITDAQRCRGLKTNQGSIASKVKTALSLMVPTVVNSLERSYNLAEALEARGYSGKRTSFFTETWTLKDKLLTFLYSLSVFYLVFSRITFGLSYWNAMAPYGGVLRIDPFVIGIIILLLAP